MKTLIIFVAFYSVITTLANNCDHKCSIVYDPVCGLITAEDGDKTFKIFQNLCTLLHAACIMESTNNVLEQTTDESCGIKKTQEPEIAESGRRLVHTSYVGVFQACNHTCPTYCVDTYDPVCAAILDRHDEYEGIMFRKPMINHCHVDLLSCTFGLNVTIQPMTHCYKNAPKLMFMQQVAGLKNLGLVDESGEYERLMEAKNKGAKTRRWLRRFFRRFLENK